MFSGSRISLYTDVNPSFLAVVYASSLSSGRVMRLLQEYQHEASEFEEEQEEHENDFVTVLASA